MQEEEQDKKVSKVISDAAEAKPAGNLSDEDLDKVAGGAAISTSRSNIKHPDHGASCTCSRCTNFNCPG